MGREGRLEQIPIERRVESFADDLNTRRGIVSGRVALLPRSTEIQPSSLRFVPPFCPSLSARLATSYCPLGLRFPESANNYAKSRPSQRSLVHVFSRAPVKRAQDKGKAGPCDKSHVRPPAARAGLKFRDNNARSREIVHFAQSKYPVLARAEKLVFFLSRTRHGCIGHTKRGHGFRSLGKNTGVWPSGYNAKSTSRGTSLYLCKMSRACAGMK